MELTWPKLFALRAFLCRKPQGLKPLRFVDDLYCRPKACALRSTFTCAHPCESVLPLRRADFLDHYSFARVGGDDFPHHLLRCLQGKNSGQRDHAQHVANVLGDFHDQIAFAHSPFAADPARRALDQRLSFPIPATCINPLVISLLSCARSPDQLRGIAIYLSSTPVHEVASRYADFLQ